MRLKFDRMQSEPAAPAFPGRLKGHEMTPSERLSALADGKDPLLIMRLKSGFAVMSHTQFLRGYCLLLGYPEVPSLQDLTPEGKLQFMHDLCQLGEAVQRATGCDRVNYGIYGNLDRFLHAHVVPRYNHEMPPFNEMPPMNYPEEIRTADEHLYDPIRHRNLQQSIRQHLQDICDRGHSPGFIHGQGAAHHPSHE